MDRACGYPPQKEFSMVAGRCCNRFVGNMLQGQSG